MPWPPEGLEPDARDVHNVEVVADCGRIADLVPSVGPGLKVGNLL